MYLYALKNCGKLEFCLKIVESYLCCVMWNQPETVNSFPWVSLYASYMCCIFFFFPSVFWALTGIAASWCLQSMVYMQPKVFCEQWTLFWKVRLEEKKGSVLVIFSQKRSAMATAAPKLKRSNWFPLLFIFTSYFIFFLRVIRWFFKPGLDIPFIPCWVGCRAKGKKKKLELEEIYDFS